MACRYACADESGRNYEAHCDGDVLVACAWGEDYRFLDSVDCSDEGKVCRGPDEHTSVPKCVLPGGAEPGCEDAFDQIEATQRENILCSVSAVAPEGLGDTCTVCAELYAVERFDCTCGFECEPESAPVCRGDARLECHPASQQIGAPWVWVRRGCDYTCLGPDADLDEATCVRSANPYPLCDDAVPQDPENLPDYPRYSDDPIYLRFDGLTYACEPAEDPRPDKCVFCAGPYLVDKTGGCECSP